MQFTGNIRHLRRKSWLGQIILVLLGTEMLFLGSFATLMLPTGSQQNLKNYLQVKTKETISVLPSVLNSQIIEHYSILKAPTKKVRFSPYVPLAPLAIFAGYILGLPLGFICTSLFVMMGLAGPYFKVLPFAEGGGLTYWQQPGFGYLLGMIVASWFVGRVTMSARSSLRQLLSVIGGLFLVHAVGLTYLLATCLAVVLIPGSPTHFPWQIWLFEEIRNLSWYSLFYDFVFALLLIGIGFPFRFLVNLLTAPDLALVPKSRWRGKLNEA